MKRRHAVALFAGVAALSVAGGAGYRLLRGDRGAGDRAAVEQLLAARLPDLKGEAQPLGQWRGRVLVVNFWATWCAPCREEVPVFVRLQGRHGARGLQFIGIALDEPAKVAEFAREFAINYPILTGGLGAMELMRQAGNRAGVLPYTLIIGRDGTLAAREPGGLKENRLESLLKPLL